MIQVLIDQQLTPLTCEHDVALVEELWPIWKNSPCTKNGRLYDWFHFTIDTWQIYRGMCSPACRFWDCTGKFEMGPWTGCTCLIISGCAFMCRRLWKSLRSFGSRFWLKMFSVVWVEAPQPFSDRMGCRFSSGLPQSNADKQNLDLIQQALAATDHFNLPFVILGDFNCNPMSLFQKKPLPVTWWIWNFFTLPIWVSLCHALAKESHGQITLSLDVQPPGGCTKYRCCHRETLTHTRYHQVVLFDLSVFEQDLLVYHLPLPRAWMDLDIYYKHVPTAFDLAVSKLGTPISLCTWVEVVECAIDSAYRQTQLRKGFILQRSTAYLSTTEDDVNLAGLKKFLGSCSINKPAGRLCT